MESDTRHLSRPRIAFFLPPPGERNSATIGAEDTVGCGFDCIRCPVVAMLQSMAAPTSDCSKRLVTVTEGVVHGIDAERVTAYLGIPYAKPPVGDLRWKPPQPHVRWAGLREADRFAPRPMQQRLFDDMVFRSDCMSEDCLYLNVWTPAGSPTESLPVLVYFFGGGFQAGDSSENRYDGASMARRGIVTVTVNYRLNAFGFLAHPELTGESPHHASGNYGLLDQNAALKWVVENIAAFGGDPKNITIAVESAGSISVSAQKVSLL